MKPSSESSYSADECFLVPEGVGVMVGLTGGLR